MSPSAFVTVLLTSLLAAAGASAQESTAPDPADANKERLFVDDMEDVSDWSTGSPVETTLSAGKAHVREGRFALKFANLVDHTTGEDNYPVGWPRARKTLGRSKLTDWSEYDFFECWIYAETSRDALPDTPIGLGFYNAAAKRASSFYLNEVKKDAWTKIVVPVSEIDDPSDVHAVQFHISESNYRHGDRVDFYVDDMVLTRFVRPVIVGLDVRRKLLYASQRRIIASYTLMGRRGMADARLQFAVGPAGGAPAGQSTAPASRQGEISLTIAEPLKPGAHWARLTLHDREHKETDRTEVEFRVIEGPFPSGNRP